MTREVERLLLSHARASIAARLGLEVQEPDHIHSLERMGCFVTLYKAGKLRGCIGCIQAVEDLEDQVREYACLAAFEDYRFAQLRPEELEGITIEISLLSPLRRVSSYREFKAGEMGIMMSLHGRKAVFLPQVAKETGWNEIQMLMALCQKAGLDQESYKDPEASFWTFTAHVFGEEDEM